MTESERSDIDIPSPEDESWQFLLDQGLAMELSDGYVLTTLGEKVRKALDAMKELETP